MKRKMIIALAVCTALTFSFTGCGGGNNNAANSVTSSDTEISSDISADSSADQEQPEEVPENGGTAENGGKADSSAGVKQDEVKETPSGSQASNSASSSQHKPQSPAQTSKPSVSAPSSGSAGASSSGSGGASASAPEKKAPTKADAQAFIGKSASSMIEAIGAPASKSYASSCMGDGEDGELHYSGFTVYTYKEGSSEKVTDVE